MLTRPELPYCAHLADPVDQALAGGHPRSARIRPRFTRELYFELKRKGTGLEDFLRQQLEEVGGSRPEDKESGLVLDLLAFHVTREGTAEEHTREELQKNYSQDGILSLAEDLKSAYLLADPREDRHDKAEGYRLAHDTLAPLVQRWFQESDRPGPRARRLLENRAHEWRDGRVGTPLDDHDLALVEAGLQGMRKLKGEEERLLEESRRRRELLRYRKLAEHLAAESQIDSKEYPQRSLLLAVESIKAAAESGVAVPAARQALYDALTVCSGSVWQFTRLR
jgi:hypothetical protein